jgi:hypothetical protein
MYPQVSPTSIAAVLLAESLFGVGYNLLVSWAHSHRIWHVSVSVVIGVAVTGLLPTAAWFGADMPFWQAGLLFLACFGSSGIWMVIGSTRRTVAKSHKRQTIPPSARRIRDEIVMDLSTLAGEIADRAKAGKLVAGDLPHYVHQLHQAIGALNNL